MKITVVSNIRIYYKTSSISIFFNMKLIIYLFENKKIWLNTINSLFYFFIIVQKEIRFINSKFFEISFYTL